MATVRLDEKSPCLGKLATPLCAFAAFWLFLSLWYRGTLGACWFAELLSRIKACHTCDEQIWRPIGLDVTAGTRTPEDAFVQQLGGIVSAWHELLCAWCTEQTRRG